VAPTNKYVIVITALEVSWLRLVTCTYNIGTDSKSTMDIRER